MRTRGSATVLLALVIVLSACGAGQQPGGSANAGTPAAADDTPLTFTPETDAAAEGTVTFAEGGTINATASDGTTFTLVVPPEAVPGDTDITMTPLSEIEGIEADALHGVLLEPDGLEFHELTRLTITPAEPIPLEQQVGFEADGEGERAGPALIDPASEEIVLLIEHFSVAGIATADEAQRARMLEKGAANAETRLNSQVRARIGEERYRQLTGEESAEAVDRAALDAVATEYQREVLDKRRAAAEESCRALRTYVKSVISWERQWQLTGLTGAEEAASQGRIEEANQYAQSRMDECEQEAIAACQEAPDHQILMDFWLWIDAPADKKRAEEICEPKALQFEMAGAGTVNAGGFSTPVTWELWGLKCDGRDDWMIWENVAAEGGASTRTGSPGEDGYGPLSVTFGDDGVVSDATWPGAGDLDPNQMAPEGWGTMAGTVLTLVPADKPTEVNAVIRLGGLTDSAPVEPADGSIPGCEPAASPG